VQFSDVIECGRVYSRTFACFQLSTMWARSHFEGRSGFGCSMSAEPIALALPCSDVGLEHGHALQRDSPVAVKASGLHLTVLEMWASQFAACEPNHYVFPFEKCGAKGEEDSFGFTGGTIFYQTDPNRPIGDWKEAWEKAKERAAAILSRNEDEISEARQAPETERTAGRPRKNIKMMEEKRRLKSLTCRFHDLRHTAVTRLLEAGIPYPVMASMMGWSAATTIRMAKRYGHIGSHALREAADVLGRFGIPLGSLKKSPKSGEVKNVAVQ
jgi:hypothetical protein